MGFDVWKVIFQTTPGCRDRRASLASSYRPRIDRKVTFPPGEPGVVAGHGGGVAGPHSDRGEGREAGQGDWMQWMQCIQGFCPLHPGLNSLMFNNLIQK